MHVDRPAAAQWLDELVVRLRCPKIIKQAINTYMHALLDPVLYLFLTIPKNYRCYCYYYNYYIVITVIVVPLLIFLLFI